MSRQAPSPADHTYDLLCRARGCPPAERRRLLEEVVTAHMGVATAIAARYRTRGIAAEDLRQVAYLALVKAAHGYDPEVGHEFLSYALGPREQRTHGVSPGPTPGRGA